MNRSIGSIIGTPRYSSIRRAASIIAPIPDSYICIVRLETPAISARVPKLIPVFSRMDLNRLLFSLTYNPPGAVNINGGIPSNNRSYKVLLDMIGILNLE